MYTDAHPGPSSKPVDTLSAVQCLVSVCLSGTADDQRTCAMTLDGALSSKMSVPPGLVRYYGGAAKSHQKDHKDGLTSLFRAIEFCSDDLACIKLCTVAEMLLKTGDAKATSKRHRRLVKSDACSYLIRGLRARLRSSVAIVSRAPDERLQHATQAVNLLAELILSYGSRDGRLVLKLRVCGLLPALYSLLGSPDIFSPSPSVLALLARAVRSPRNAQAAGRHRGVLSSLLARVISLNKNDVIQLQLLARHLEILYFITKNRRSRVQLIGEGVVSGVMPLVERHLDWSKLRSNRSPSTRQPAVHIDNIPSSTVHTELCLVAVALLRLLANNKRAKDELVERGAIGICEKAIGTLTRDEDDRDPVVRQLQDSLCALCLRCLPTLNFPLAGVTFPLRTVLPRPTSPKKRSVSRSPMKPQTAIINGGDTVLPVMEPGGSQVSPAGPYVLPSTPLKTPSRNLSSSLDDSGQLSSDDDCLDEEDGAFLLGEDDEVREEEMEEDVEEISPTKEETLVLSRQKPSELSLYEALFAELKDGCQGHAPRSPIEYAAVIERQLESTCSVVPLCKAAFPEWRNPDVDMGRQALVINSDSMREMVVQAMARARLRAPFTPRVVFDLDSLCAANAAPRGSAAPDQSLSCDDKLRIGHSEGLDHLLFESRFESGNLRRATMVAPNHYELVLSPDVNQVKDHYQWYYFEVSNVRSNVSYTFEIINCLKTSSMYSTGMQPVMYSVKEAVQNNAGWTRAGENVCYYRNLYTTPDDTVAADGEKTRKRYFYSIRFNVTFRHKNDVCYFAYHYPYTYSFLKATLERFIHATPSSIFVRHDVICHSLGGNGLPLITVTAPGSVQDLAEREIVVLSARVHPGESNASWMMHGVLEYLMTSKDSNANGLRNRFVFKLIPMLNPDGVINGSHRCSLAGVDLNRVWNKPNRNVHPEIYHTKGLLQYMSEVEGRTPFVFVDLHGHSRRSNVFVFGNNPEESYRASDKATAHNFEFMTLPEILEQQSAGFSFKNCRFNVTRGKESSARVTVWRQFGVARAYTMESTYCGFETGPYRGYQIGTKELKEMGRQLCVALLEIRSSTSDKSPVKRVLRSRKIRPRRVVSVSSGEAERETGE